MLLTDVMLHTYYHAVKVAKCTLYRVCMPNLFTHIFMLCVVYLFMVCISFTYIVINVSGISHKDRCSIYVL